MSAQMSSTDMTMRTEDTHTPRQPSARPRSRDRGGWRMGDWRFRPSHSAPAYVTAVERQQWDEVEDEEQRQVERGDEADEGDELGHRASSMPLVSALATSMHDPAHTHDRDRALGVALARAERRLGDAHHLLGNAQDNAYRA